MKRVMRKSDWDRRRIMVMTLEDWSERIKEAASRGATDKNYDIFGEDKMWEEHGRTLRLDIGHDGFLKMVRDTFIEALMDFRSYYIARDKNVSWEDICKAFHWNSATDEFLEKDPDEEVEYCQMCSDRCSFDNYSSNWLQAFQCSNCGDVVCEDCFTDGLCHGCRESIIECDSCRRECSNELEMFSDILFCEECEKDLCFEKCWEEHGDSDYPEYCGKCYRHLKEKEAI